MAYDARRVANYLFDLASNDSASIFPLKMQKLVYLAHGWNLVRRGERLVSNDFEAWRYGPVVPELYHALKKYGSTAVKAPIKGFTSSLDEESNSFVDAVWQRYRSLTGIQLSTITHEPGYAWDLTIKNAHGLTRSLVIPDELIEYEFQRRAQK